MTETKQRKNAARPLYPDRREIKGLTFLPVVERDGEDYQGFARFRQVLVNGKALWALPGGLMCFEQDLPRVADSLLFQRRNRVR